LLANRILGRVKNNNKEKQKLAIFFVPFSDQTLLIDNRNALSWLIEVFFIDCKATSALPLLSIHSVLNTWKHKISPPNNKLLSGTSASA